MASLPPPATAFDSPGGRHAWKVPKRTCDFIEPTTYYQGPWPGLPAHRGLSSDVLFRSDEIHGPDKTDMILTDQFIFKETDSRHVGLSVHVLSEYYIVFHGQVQYYI